MHSKLFVYGTLKKGFYNHKAFRLNSQICTDLNALIEGISLVQSKSLNYPFAIKNKAGNVQGEVYLVENELLKEITRLERKFGYSRVMMRTTKNEEVFVFVDKKNRYPRLKRFSKFKGVK